ncbi:HMCN1 protein, partial [Certhia brachydactyla]|nr:HMCN1 protein [Certhia brachydactyla]
QRPRCRAAGPWPGSTERARRRESSSPTASTTRPTCPGCTGIAPPSTSPTCRCGWCCSEGTAACTACGPSRRPRPGSSCALWVSAAAAGPPPWQGGVGALTLPLLPLPEPLGQPKIVGNPLVKAGSSAELVCHVLQGKADAYWWKKNGELLLGSERIQFVDNTTLCILGASISDSGYYTCVVSNAVSQNETSFLLKVH